MIALIASLFIFGLIHPLSKVILDSGIPLSYFCLTFVGIRLFFQIPAAIIKREVKIDNRKDFLMLILFGVVGAALQFFEFKAIKVGLTPGTVTFLMFTYPIWISIFHIFKGQSNDSSAILLLKLILALSGMFLICNAAIDELSSFNVIYPLLAGLSIALWILISTKLRKSGLAPIKISVYYDLFSFLFLVLNFNKNLVLDFEIFLNWHSLSNAMIIVLYSLIIGLLPNMLFYYGSKSVNPLTSGMAMSFEPIFSTLYSYLIWGIALTEFFLLGAIFIFLANMPSQLILLCKSKVFLSGRTS